MSNESSSGSAIGLPTLLLVVFIVLKLINVISWSWLWVLSPLWITAGLSLILVAISYVFFRNK